MTTMVPRHAAGAPVHEAPLLFRRQALPLALTVVVLVLWNFDKLWSMSIDLPHHYVLAYRLAEEWRLPVKDPSLGGMNDYPWMAHALVAIVGTLLHSVFAGLQVVALLSLAGVWVAILGLLCNLPRQQAAWTCIALAALVVVNGQFLGINLHGSEIVNNYFFSQLTAQALMFGALWSAAVVERRRGWATAAATLGLWVQVIAFFHLLPALLLAGTAVLAMVLGLVMQVVRRTARRSSFLWSGALLVLMCAAVLVHPAFEDTRKIAANDGSLDLAFITFPVGVMSLALLSAVVALAQVWIGATRSPAFAPIRYLGLYGLTTSGLCVLQLVALKLGHGSAYSVKKYGFALTTFLAIALALAIGWGITRALRGRRLDLPLGHGATGVLVCSALGVIFMSVVPSAQLLHASDLTRLEQQLIHVRDIALPAPPPGKYDIAFDLQGFPPQVSYMFSTAILRTPMDEALDDIMVSGSLTHGGDIAHVVTTTPPKPLAGSKCQGATYGSLSVYSPDCFTVPTAPCKGTFDFAAHGGLASTVFTGFSRNEPSGRWSEGHKATFSCIVQDPSAVREMVITAAPFMAGELKQQRIRVGIGANPAREYTVNDWRELVVPVGTMSRGRLDVTFEFPDAASPASVGFNADARVLGFLVRSVGFR